MSIAGFVTLLFWLATATLAVGLELERAGTPGSTARVCRATERDAVRCLRVV